MCLNLKLSCDPFTVGKSSSLALSAEIWSQAPRIQGLPSVPQCDLKWGQAPILLEELSTYFEYLIRKAFDC